MKYVDEFRDPAKAKVLLEEIERWLQRIAAVPARPLHLMEVCGGHTHAIFRYGIENRCCPRRSSSSTARAARSACCRWDGSTTASRWPSIRSVIFTTFGDAMRVPGSKKSLLQAKADGADVRMVYSPLDALKIAREHPDREVVFFALGFETTMPSTALTVLQAERRGVENFSLFCNHITIIPTIKAILDSPDLQLDGFLGPGHVSMVIGTRAVRLHRRHYRKPLVVAGFEPLDILQSVWMVLKQIAEGRCEVENQYKRVVPDARQRAALDGDRQSVRAARVLRMAGLGSIDHSGCASARPTRASTPSANSRCPNLKIADPKSCQCGEVLKGVIKPWDCKVFGSACTPETPLGALMVSSEGACAAYYSMADRSWRA